MTRRSRSFRAVTLVTASCLACLVALGGCQVDPAVAISAPGASASADHLSALGIFVGSPVAQVPRGDFHPYDVNVTLYADGASKYRFVYVPPGTSIRVTDDRWEIPVGAYFVKTFFYPRDARDPSLGEQLLETRFLVKTGDGLLASTYVWDDAQTDAVASGGNVDIPVHWTDAAGARHDDSYHVPGTSQCASCHEDRALGWRSRQIADGTSATTGQIDRLLSAGVIDSAPVDPQPLVDPFGEGLLDDRARAYLDANCSHCHATEGSAASTKLYWDREHTGPGDLAICRKTSKVDGDDRVIVPGDPAASAFVARMESADPFLRMPRGPTHIPDSPGLAVLEGWIEAMTPAGCK